MPKLSMRQLIRSADQKNGMGFDYAYVYPGMNKVLQAAGRVIRTEEDYGLVPLIDSRFGTKNTGPCFGALVPHKNDKDISELKSLLEDFAYFK